MRLARVLIRILTLSCEDAAAIVSRSLDDRPARTERLALRLHLACCPGCRRFDRQMTFLRRVMARLRARFRDEDAPCALVLPPDARERIRAALEEASKSTPPSSPGGILDRD